MDISALGRIVLVCAAATVAVDATATGPVSAPKNGLFQPGAALVGCLSRGETIADIFRSSLPADDRKRDAPDDRRIHIVGGLVPSANVAAQAGAIDPALAFMAAALWSTGTGAARPPDLHIEHGDLTALPQTGRCH